MTAVACAWMVGTSAAQAVPFLQTYIEGSSYDSGDETWVVDPADGKTLRLWVVANTKKDSVNDVRLYVAFPDGISGLNISITPTTIGGSGSLTVGGIDFVDPSLSSNPTLADNGNGTTPDGLQPHGVYGAGTLWQEYKLGDFTLTDSTLANFEPPIGSDKPGEAQINAYDIVITADANTPPFSVHFDVAGIDPNNGKFSAGPNSHDSAGNFFTPDPPPPTPAPEPATLLLLAVGGLGSLGGRWWGRNRNR